MSSCCASQPDRRYSWMLPRWRGQPAARWWVAGDVPPDGSYLSSAEEPRRARMMSLVRSSVGPGRGGDRVTGLPWGCGHHHATGLWSSPCRGHHHTMVATTPWDCAHHHATGLSGHRHAVVTTILRLLPHHGTVLTTMPQGSGHCHAMVTTVPWDYGPHHAMGLCHHHHTMVATIPWDCGHHYAVVTITPWDCDGHHGMVPTMPQGHGHLHAMATTMPRGCNEHHTMSLVCHRTMAISMSWPPPCCGHRCAGTHRWR